jgi:hypothetical protein
MGKNLNIRYTFIWLIIWINTIHGSAQEISYGVNNYIAYQMGNIPLVISVPHGGNVAPASIPDRTCPNAVTVTDLNTQQIAKEISNNIFSLTGCYPHIVYCNLKRSKLDCNRNMTDGTCDHPEALTAWKEYHDFMLQAITNSDVDHSFNTFMIDIHGHGKPSQRIELGYLLDEIELENTDLVLNTSAFINNSSLRKLALQNKNNLQHADLIRGALSFGTLLHDKGYPAVPSSQIPSPGGDNTYYNGGYITAHYTSYNPAIEANGFQIELNYSGLRNTTENIKKFAVVMADAILEYMYAHRDILKNSCQPASITLFDSSTINVWYSQDNHGIHITGKEFNEMKYEICQIDGKRISSGHANYGILELQEDIRPGMYVFLLKTSGGRLIKAFKFVIQ